MASELRVPTLGESVAEATVGKWLKQPGEAVKADEPLVELETDKVSIEVPAPADGSISEIVAKEGETVEVGALIAHFADGASGSAPAPAAAKSAPAQSTPAKSASSGKMVDVNVPSGGESVTEAQVGSVYKKVGDAVSVDEAILELETDKAAQEVLSPVAGVIREMNVNEGDDVEVGALLLRIEEGADGGASAPTASAAATPEPASAGGSTMPPSPAAKKILEEKGIDPARVEGSGKRGQVLKQDAQAASASPAPASAQVSAPATADEAGREERVKMTRLRQTIARRLKEAQSNAAMLTTFNEVDMSAVMSLRTKYKELFEKKHGVKLGFMGFFTKAVCHALEEIPAVNAEIDGTDIVYKHFCHIGVAVGTDKGLVVPVVRDADQMSIAEIEKEIGNLGRKARDGELQVSDMQGGTFTISNGGVYGSLMSTPILNAPQSGILGMHKIQERPVAVAGEIKLRPMMYLALSYDHRIVDGKEAVTFLVRVKESLEDPERLVLDL
ncbi:MAG: 2-oxoglutarate dehydrogenase complex dihydrolipoyllysine-residue succinyltransferase [Rhizobiaceae bacterium]